MKRRVAAALLTCLLLAAPLRAAELPEKGAAVVLGFVADTVELGRAPAPSEQEQRARLKLILDRRFDMPAVARFALGRHWHSATPAQVQEFTALLERMIVQVYGARFLDPSQSATDGPDERFQIVTSRAEGELAVLITSKVLRPNGAKPTRIDWRLSADAAGEPKIIDVMVEGISLRLSYQEDFGATIQRSGRGIDGLLEQMRAKLAS